MSKSKKRSYVDYERQKDRGWICMHRGWQDHPVFGGEPFTHREAWEWLILEATYSYEGRLIVQNGLEVRLSRGQLSFSLRFMSKTWGWTLSKTDRFIKKIKNNNMIETETETGQLIITICNYNKYQIEYEKSETDFSTPLKQKGNITATNKKKGNKDKNVKGKSPITNSCAHMKLPNEDYDITWKRFIAKNLESAHYNSWIYPLRKDTNGYIWASKQSHADWCKNHYGDIIKKSLDNERFCFQGFKSFEKDI